MADAIKRAATYLSRELNKKLEPKQTGRLLASVNPEFKGMGLTNYVSTDISGFQPATIQFDLPEGLGHKDAVTFSEKVITVPSIGVEFKIKANDIFAWDNRSVGPGQTNSLESITADTAAFEVVKRENDMIYKGWNPEGTTPKIFGFNDAANNVVTGGAITEAGQLLGYVSDAIALLNEDSVYGDNEAYNVVIPPWLKAKIRVWRQKDAVQTELREIQDIIGNGQVIIAPEMVGVGSGKSDIALVTPVDSNREHFEFLNPVPPVHRLAAGKFPESPVEGMCYEYFRLRVKRPNAQDKTNAIAKINGLAKPTP